MELIWNHCRIVPAVFATYIHDLSVCCINVILPGVLLCFDDSPFLTYTSIWIILSDSSAITTNSAVIVVNLALVVSV